MPSYRHNGIKSDSVRNGMVVLVSDNVCLVGYGGSEKIRLTEIKDCRFNYRYHFIFVIYNYVQLCLLDVYQFYL